MKLLIAVLSCQRDRGLHDVIRGTWGQDAKSLGVETRFFVSANPQKYERDEIHLACQDTRSALPYKVREICKWANSKQIEYLFVCHTDTIPKPAKLLAILATDTRFDYGGRFNNPLGKTFRYDSVGPDGLPEHHERCYPWASSGFGYFLSRRAYSEIAAEHPTSSVDDLWVGQALGPLVAEGHIAVTDITEPYSTHKEDKWER